MSVHPAVSVECCPGRSSNALSKMPSSTTVASLTDDDTTRLANWAQRSAVQVYIERPWCRGPK